MIASSTFSSSNLSFVTRFYGIVCVKPSYIGSNRDKSSRGFFKDAANWRNLAFATSCRQIYEEMSNVFYAQNGFEFNSGPPFLEFLKGIGRKGRKGRRTLTKLGFVNTTTGMPFIALRYLKPCDNLHKLEIYVEGWIADHRDQVFTKMPVPWAVLCPFETASCVLSWQLDRDRIRYRQNVSRSRIREEERGQQARQRSRQHSRQHTGQIREQFRNQRHCA